ncbi:putative kelch repeat protein [Phaeomoniella chlamydospora]|uniref:Putative kelch repeat protein n=1 Tax=Phaeomoniella chlamydospora TaxID=158046 RepID=A0A0G2H1A7_PHACM|nr:putative kelch repeat protein [Phaeomoniella chlamydospora]
MTGLPIPSGPPPVANGFLWNSYTKLFLYGGEYSDNPVTSPSAYALWTYDIPSSSWSSVASPTTTAGTNSDDGGVTVQQAAEGAGINIPQLGLGYYFGGHLDGYTTEGWSQSIARVYLRSMIEFTFPGFANAAIDGDPTAGSSGLWRNITTGGLQDSAGFTERADGILAYIPGYGKNGIIIGLAGGTNATFTQMNVIDVYDIATSTWYKQYTSGTTPEYRVNPCAVVVSAPDGSSTNVYMFGGQNLLPYGEQTQYSDTWILTIPSFTWIKVDTSDQSVPPGRSGHTCNVWNSQMVVVGGYVGEDLSCDSPGIYVFDTANLTWINEYKSLETDTSSNPQNQQESQEGDASGLAGSFDYKVPAKVQSVIGGNSEGGATVTSPVASATSGPFATGSARTYSVTETGTAAVSTVTSKTTSTDSSGAVSTETTVSTIPSGGGSSSDGGDNKGARLAAIIAGVIAGVLFLLAAYLGWCVYMYRRHLTLYKNHVAMSQRVALGVDTQNKTGLLFPGTGGREFSSDDTHVRPSEEGSSTGKSGKRGRGYVPVPGGKSEGGGFTTGDSSSGGNRGGDSASISSTEDLLRQGEPSLMGVFLNPRRTLRVVNT